MLRAPGPLLLEGRLVPRAPRTSLHPSPGRGQRRPATSRRSSAPPAGNLPAAHVAEIQRSRLLAGAVRAIDEHGYAHTTVAQITGRSRVSRRTFYELFENREACLTALVEDVVGSIEQELAEADLQRLPWQERIRGGLAVILAFIDREPTLARVCVVQAAQGGASILAYRRRILDRLAEALDEGRGKGPRAGDCSPLTAEGLLGAACGILDARLAEGVHEPLMGLLGELMSMIVLPYLGPAAARREQSRPVPVPGAAPAGRPPLMVAADSDPLQEIPMRLTYRTAKVLECIAAHPGVSNRMVADRAGISDQGQISKLLARLERLELAENRGDGQLRGEPNAWTLTALGEQVTRRLSASSQQRRQAA